MSATKHTPGPYRADGEGWIVIEGNPYGHGRMHVADVRGWGHLTGGGACNYPPEKAAEIQDANGRLLAAAPELLDALRALVDDEPCRLDHNGVCQTHNLDRPCSVAAALAVIEKATKP